MLPREIISDGPPCASQPIFTILYFMSLTVYYKEEIKEKLINTIKNYVIISM